MFSMLPSPIHTRSQPPHHYYTPVKPSPLSSSPLRPSPTSPPLSQRDANVPTSSPPGPSTNCHFDFTPSYANVSRMSPSPTPKPRTPAQSPSTRLPTPPASTSTTSTSSGSTSSRDAGRDTAFSRRPTKANPLIHRGTQEEGREARRRLFLRRVRDSAADKRYGGDEEMMRRIWVAEEKRVEEERKREAASVGLGLEDILEFEDPENTTAMGSQDEMLVEEVARDELEWEAFLEMMEEQEQQPPQQQQQQSPQADTPYGSDDEEYDDIFMDVILEETRTASQQHQVGQAGEQLQHQGLEQEHAADMDMMDMS